MHIAIVGCGQLSRMLALAGLPLGLKFSFVADTENEDTVCVDGLGKVVRWHAGQSAADLYFELGQPDCVTIEKEQVDLTLLQALEDHCAVYPPSRAVAACQHRHHEKQLLETLGIPAAEYTYATPAINSIVQLGLPLVAKSCSEGYDGKNQWQIESPGDARYFDQQSSVKNSKPSGNDFIIEKKIPFSKEVSLVSVRALNGDIAHYPMTENSHKNGILKQSIAPAIELDTELSKQAQGYMSQIMVELNYIGVMAMELFVVDNALLVNELAPRVHNSGHWTQSGCNTCQFENHLRAISGFVLGSTNQYGVTGMVNLIGCEKPPRTSITAQSTLHWYNKNVRPGRKLGHVNFVAENHDGLVRQIIEFHKAKTQLTANTTTIVADH